MIGFSGGSVEGCPYCGSQHAFVVLTGAVAWPDHVDDVPGRHGPGGGDRGLAVSDRSVGTNPLRGLFLNHPASGVHDRGGHTAAVGEMLVRRVNDGVDVLPCQVALNGFDSRRSDLHTVRVPTAYAARVQVIAALLLFAVSLGPSFRDGTVVGTRSSPDELQLDISVEVAGSPDAVVAHLIDPGNTQATVSLAAQGAGRWGGVATVERANLVVVFEAIRGSDSDVSEPATLLELGLDPTLLGLSPTTTTPPEQGLSQETVRWGWLGLALGAAALALLAFWALGERGSGEGTDGARLDEEPGLDDEPGPSSDEEPPPDASPE